eukprot:scaffold843_cov35-Tisochrysis_lutea.AAC.3
MQYRHDAIKAQGPDKCFDAKYEDAACSDWNVPVPVHANPTTALMADGPLPFVYCADRLALIDPAIATPTCQPHAIHKL